MFLAQSPSIFAAFPNLPKAGRGQVLVLGRRAVRSSRRGRRTHSLLHLVARRSSQRRRYFNSAVRTVECAPRVGKARTSFPPPAEMRLEGAKIRPVSPSRKADFLRGGRDVRLTARHIHPLRDGIADLQVGGEEPSDGRRRRLSGCLVIYRGRSINF